MYRPMQPSPTAHFALTRDASPLFATFEANVAVERANTPGMVRVYRRATPSSLWSPAGQILDSAAARLYGWPLRPDTSD